MKKEKNQFSYKPYGNSFASLKSKGCSPTGTTLRKAIANAYNCTGDNNEAGKFSNNGIPPLSANHTAGNNNLLFNPTSSNKATNQGDLLSGNGFTNSFKINSKSINALLDNIIMEEFFTECSKPKLNRNIVREEEQASSECKSNMNTHPLHHSKHFSKSISEVSSLSQTHFTTSLSEKFVNSNKEKVLENGTKQAGGDKADDGDTVDNLSLLGQESQDPRVPILSHTAQEQQPSVETSPSCNKNPIFFVQEENDKDVIITVEKNSNAAILSLVAMFPDKNIHIKQLNDLSLKQDAVVNTDKNESTVDNDSESGGSSVIQFRKPKSFFLPRRKKSIFNLRSKPKRFFNEEKSNEKYDDVSLNCEQDDIINNLENQPADSSSNKNPITEEKIDENLCLKTSEQIEEIPQHSKQEKALQCNVQDEYATAVNTSTFATEYTPNTTGKIENAESVCSLIISEAKISTSDDEKRENLHNQVDNYYGHNMPFYSSTNIEHSLEKEFKIYCDDFYTWFKRICDNDESGLMKAPFYLEKQFNTLNLSEKVPISFISDKQQEEWFKETNKLPKMARSKVYHQHRCRTVAQLRNQDVYHRDRHRRKQGSINAESLSSSSSTPDNRTPVAGCQFDCKSSTPYMYPVDNEILSMESSSCSCFTEGSEYVVEDSNQHSIHDRSSTVYIDGIKKKKRTVIQPKLTNLSAQNLDNKLCGNNDSCFQNINNVSSNVYNPQNNDNKNFDAELKRQKKCKLLFCFQ